MKVYNNLFGTKLESDSVITIGNFDGVHIGHQALINYTVSKAREMGINSLVFTFSNHPVNYFKPGSVKTIMSEEEKVDFLEKLGVDILVNIPFDEYMTHISAKDFIENDLIGKLNMKYLVAGHDFTFARNREGNPQFLESVKDTYNFGLKIFYPIKSEDERISSTAIREAIFMGDMEKAKEYLGRFFLLKGKVYRSRQNGRKIGFPTANITIDDHRILPKGGIYVSRVCVGGKNYWGATNVGFNPTVEGKGYSIETFIFDFNDDIYGSSITFEFISRIRDEIKFNSLDELKNQIQKDTKYIKENYICKYDIDMLE